MVVNEQTAAAVGRWVTIRDGEQEDRWQIVDTAEADAANGRISEDSPLARALIGHVPGDVVSIHGPGGIRPVVLLRVEDQPINRRPRFVLARSMVAGRGHALHPEATSGPTLCGCREDSARWLLEGFTRRVGMIACPDCRSAADAIVVRRSV